MHDAIAQAEDAWWEERVTSRHSAERRAMERAMDSADLNEFDSEAERLEYIEQMYDELMGEYENGR